MQKGVLPGLSSLKLSEVRSPHEGIIGRIVTRRLNVGDGMTYGGAIVEWARQGSASQSGGWPHYRRARWVRENILSGRRTGAQMARLYGVSPATVSRIVNSCQTAQPKDENML